MCTCLKIQNAGVVVVWHLEEKSTCHGLFAQSSEAMLSAHIRGFRVLYRFLVDVFVDNCSHLRSVEVQLGQSDHDVGEGESATVPEYSELVEGYQVNSETWC